MGRRKNNQTNKKPIPTPKKKTSKQNKQKKNKTKQTKKEGIPNAH